MTIPDQSNQGDFNQSDPSQEPRVSADVSEALSAMSRWGSDGSEPWRAALAQSRPQSRPLKLARAPWLQTIAAVVVLALIIGIMLPSIRPSVDAQAGSPSRSSRADSTVVYKRSEMSPGRDAGLANGAMDTHMAPEALAYAATLPSSSPPPPPPPPQSERPIESQDRQVIRKATIELKSKSVRAVFAKAAQVLSEANGEYIESSSLTGDNEEELQGQMTLRVTAARLSTVLGQLRELGAVVNERSTGEDVTDTVVDVEARLRNEQRVEAELLQLLESRKDAPLKEILDLRSEIASIRINIERLTAQRERLGRLVSLSTILVIIHPDSTRPAPLPDGIGDYFLKQVRVAWQGSLALLSDTVALLIKVFVGGALFWILGVIVTVAILIVRRRALRKMEPAPRL